MELKAMLRPLLQQVESLTEKIKVCEAELNQIATEKYPETELLQQIKGVGPSRVPRAGHGSQTLGLKAGATGGKNAKKRAIVAVARKPLRNSNARQGAAQRAAA